MQNAIVDTSNAERRALKISLRLDAIADNYEAVMPMIREALQLGDHATLGYRSPGEYLADRFGKALARLPIPMRRAAVKELTDAGLSTRAIASVVGVSNYTVSTDQSAVRDLTPAAPADIGITGPEDDDLYTEDVIAEWNDDELDENEAEDVDPIIEAERVGGMVQITGPTYTGKAEPQKVTGLDGKTYSRPEPKPRATPRRALTDQFFDAAYDLGRAVEKVHRLTEDDRWTNNKAQVASKHEADLRQAANLLDEVLRSINPNN